MTNPFAFKASNERDNVNSWINFWIREAPSFEPDSGCPITTYYSTMIIYQNICAKIQRRIVSFQFESIRTDQRETNKCKCIRSPIPIPNALYKSTIALYAKYNGIYNTYRKAECEVSCRIIFNYFCCKVSKYHHSPVLLPANVYPMHLPGTLALDLSPI